MGRKKIPVNRTKFRREFFLLLAQQSLTQCEYKCLLILAEGEELTKTKVAEILHDTKQHIGKAMLHLEDLGVIKCIRIEGRNAFFSLNLDWKPDVQQGKWISDDSGGIVDNWFFSAVRFVCRSSANKPEPVPTGRELSDALCGLPLAELERRKDLTAVKISLSASFILLQAS